VNDTVTQSSPGQLAPLVRMTSTERSGSSGWGAVLWRSTRSCYPQVSSCLQGGT
jgi:hypothetical protein